MRGDAKKQIFYALIVSTFLTSCATIVNQPHKYVTVHTTEPSSIIFGHDTIGTVENKVDEANNKGELYLHLSLPLINPFRMVLENEETKVKTGVGGVTLGLDYYHSKKQFFHLGISGLSGGFSLKSNKLEPPEDLFFTDKTLESLTSEYISFSNNHKIGRFTVGYGLSCAKNKYTDGRLGWFFIPIVDSVEKSHYAFGLIFPTYFQLSEHFNIGIVYRPTFYRPNMTDKFVYEHLISIDFALKIRVKK